MKVGLVPAAGMAKRLEISTPKELLEFKGKAIIDYSVDNLINTPVDIIVIVIRKGKESIKAHLEKKYPDFKFEFVYQKGEIGNLIDAIKASYQAIKGHQVYFCMADTLVRPNPFQVSCNEELTILCFKTEGDAWKNFGVVDEKAHKIVDKPPEFINNVCWGALIWEPTFTEKIMHTNDLPGLFNQVTWEYIVNIEEYTDIGTKKNAI